MSRKPIIAANWKMNIGPAEGAQFIESFKTILKGKDVACDTVIVPPFTTIPSVLNALGGCGCIAIGAQNVSQYDNGAYTGEISTSMLQELGLKYVVLGHSERRQYFGETDAIINAKIKKAIAAGITPIFCIGETKDERLGGILEPVLEIQLKGGLKDLTPEEAAKQEKLAAMSKEELQEKLKALDEAKLAGYSDEFEYSREELIANLKAKDDAKKASLTNENAYTWEELQKNLKAKDEAKRAALNQRTATRKTFTRGAE